MNSSSCKWVSSARWAGAALALAAALAVSPLTASAQSDDKDSKKPATIKVEVLDNTDKPIAGIKILCDAPPEDKPVGGSGSAPGGSKLKSAGVPDRVEFQAIRRIGVRVTDKDGKVEFVNLKPGNYRIMTDPETTGWSLGVQTVNLKGGQNMEVKFKLSPE